MLLWGHEKPERIVHRGWREIISKIACPDAPGRYPSLLVLGPAFYHSDQTSVAKGLRKVNLNSVNPLHLSLLMEGTLFTCLYDFHTKVTLKLLTAICTALSQNPTLPPSKDALSVTSAKKPPSIKTLMWLSFTSIVYVCTAVPGE